MRKLIAVQNTGLPPTCCFNCPRARLPLSNSLPHSATETFRAASPRFLERSTNSADRCTWSSPAVPLSAQQAPMPTSRPARGKRPPTKRKPRQPAPSL
jgi:hypothetical protein